MRAFALVIFPIVIAAAPALAQPASPAANTSPKSCFFVSEFEDWRAPDDRTIIIRTEVDHYYRLGLENACPELKFPDPHLVMNVRGPNTICSPVDWDLKVSGAPGDVPVPCIVKSMQALTPAEVDALPKKYKP